MKQSVMTFVGMSTNSMKEAADKADELMNEFIDIDDDIAVISVSTQSLYACGAFHHVITIAFRSHLDDSTNHSLP